MRAVTAEACAGCVLSYGQVVPIAPRICGKQDDDDESSSRETLVTYGEGEVGPDGLTDLQRQALHGPFTGSGWIGDSASLARDFNVDDFKGKAFVKPKKVT